MTFDEKIASRELKRSLDAYAFTISKDHDLASDLVGQTYLKLLIKKNDLEELKEITGYAVTVLRNLFLDHTRKKKEFQFTEDSDNEIPTENMEDVYVEVETETNQRNIINFCISKLSNIDREIVGYWRAGVSYRDVGDILQISIENARQRFNRAKGLLAKCLEANGV